MGELAVKLLSEGQFNRTVCVHDGRLTHMDMREAITVDSFYRKFRKNGSYDQEKYDQLTDLQKKLFEFRLNVSRRLMETAASLSEV
jgi:hypothetical protein